MALETGRGLRDAARRLHRLRHLTETEEAPVFRETLVVADLDVVAGQLALITARLVDRTVARRVPCLQDEDDLVGPVAGLHEDAIGRRFHEDVREVWRGVRHGRRIIRHAEARTEPDPPPVVLRKYQFTIDGVAGSVVAGRGRVLRVGRDRCEYRRGDAETYEQNSPIHRQHRSANAATGLERSLHRR